MATALVSNQPECCICFDSIKTPKILTCGHTFCLVCIERLIGNKTETFNCPTCQQEVQIPEGGAEKFTTNYIAIDNQPQIQPEPPSTTQPKCPNHNQKEVDYYCNNCNVGLCLKCILGQHKGHKTLDLDSDETRNKTIENLQRSQRFIQNRINNLIKTRSTLLESFEQLKSLCEDSCAKVTTETEKIVSDLRKSCKQTITDIRTNLEENRIKVEGEEIEITSDINVLESNIDSIISPSTDTTLNNILTLHRLMEAEKLEERREDEDMCIQYSKWIRNYVSLDVHRLGSVISKSFYIVSSHQFLFDVKRLSRLGTVFMYHLSKNKRRCNNLVWSCAAGRSGGRLFVDVKLLPDDNPKLNYCKIDYQISLLNIDDDSKTITKTVKDVRVEKDDSWVWNCTYWWNPTTLSHITEKNNGFLNASDQFVVQFDITQIREIQFSR